MKKKHLLPLLAALASAFVPLGVALASDKPITIYVDEYAEGQVMSHIAKNVIESEYDTPVTVKTVSVGVAFLGVAHDERSLFMAAWLPRTHEDYMNRVGDQVDNLGELFDGARIGWAVPDYVPEEQLSSIADLKKPEVADKLDAQVQGISAGAGEMQLSKKALDVYKLDDYRLITASSAAMTGALGGAIKKKQWIVVTAWSPHWMWGRFDLRYLDDPEGVLGCKEHVNAIASKGIASSAPGVHDMLSRMHFTLEQINGTLEDAEKTSYEAAAKKFIETHPDVIATWTADESG